MVDEGGGLALVPFVLRDYSDARALRYGFPPDFVLDESGNPLVIPLAFETKPWSKEAFWDHANEVGATPEGMRHWPSVLGTFLEPDYFSLTWLPGMWDTSVLRVWSVFPTDKVAIRHVQKAASKMLDRHHIPDIIDLVSAINEGEWWPGSPDVFEEDDGRALQNMHDGLVALDLVEDPDNAVRYILNSEPIEQYCTDPVITKEWRSAWIASHNNEQRVFGFLPLEDRHLEEEFSIWPSD